VVIGIGAGARAEIDLRQLMSRRAHILSSTLRARPLEERAAAARLVEKQVMPLVGRLLVPVEAVFTLSEVNAAYERFAAGGKFGKVVLDIAS
jgi:NADPH:quinone reductase-like Zn-dependent oxidoreductase